jgi:dihydroorotase
MNILIKNTLLVDPASKSESISDIRIKGELIEKIGKDLTANEDETVIDAKGLWASPGFVDIHTHLREIGQADREDISTGTKAAAAGGYTKVLTMANTEPPIDSPAMLALLQDRIEQKACIKVMPVCTVTKQMAGLDLTNMAELSDAGAQAFSDDGMPITNLAVLRRALEYLKPIGKIIISHAEDKDLSHGGAIHEGKAAFSLGLPGIPGASESAAIAREIEVARQANAHLHFAHVSTAASVSLIRFAKSEGIHVTADVTPHHLTLSDEDIQTFDTDFKMNPPLRTKQDQEAMVAGLLDGTIDAIATDHAPHTRLDKSKTMDEAPFGIIGLETAFSLAYERLVQSKLISKLDLIALFTTRPSKIIGLPEPALKAGAPADICLLDPECRWVYLAESGYSKSDNSPYNGKSLTGKNLLTIYQGKIVYQDEERMPKRLSGSLVSVQYK